MYSQLVTKSDKWGVIMFTNLMMVCSVLAKRMNTSEKRKVKWLNPNCHPMMAQTMNNPAQHRITVDSRMMILAWEEAGVFGENESCKV